MKKKLKIKLKVDNKLKGAFGETDIVDGKARSVKINVKKHKGNKTELADTIKHELMHVKHPKMTEKAVYKKMKEPMSQKEQDAMIAKLRMKKLNYKGGAAKRKLGIDRKQKVEAGSLISKMNAQKATRAVSLPTKGAERAAIMGAI